MVIFCPAKINLGLRILRKRNDGYHDIESLFFPVPLFDVLEFVPAKSLTFESTGIDIPGSPEENLVLKAYQILKKEHDIPNLKIHLHKKIPMGGGLGGGSSDAACFLKALNDYFDLGLTQEALRTKAASIGSDCAFFIAGTPQFASGRGEKLSPHPMHLKGYKILLLFPGIHISTPKAYSSVQPYTNDKPLEKLLEKPIQYWKEEVVNDFEKSVFMEFPELKHYKNVLYTQGAIFAAMSGSGSTLFGIFEPGFDTSSFVPNIPYKWIEI